MAHEQRTLSEDELFFFEDRICGEADNIFRFCLALTLNVEAAQKLLEHTFRHAAREVGSLMRRSPSEIQLYLLQQALADEEKYSGGRGAGESPVIRLLKGLAKEVRAVLVARDVIGIGFKELCALMKLEGSAVRSHLAEGRRALMQF